MHYWLMKSEPDTFGLDDLVAMPNQTEHWDGVRNYQARNFMRDQMKLGDQVFFYHSNCKEPGIVGIATVVKEAYPDHTAFDPNQKYFDPKSDPEQPRWFMVEIQFTRKLATLISLRAMKANPALDGMRLLQKGNRLSIIPIEEQEWSDILEME